MMKPTTQLTDEQIQAIKEELSILVLLEGLDIRDSIFRRVITYANLFSKLKIPTYRGYTKCLDKMLGDICNAN